MPVFVVAAKDCDPCRRVFDKLEITIGRGRDNDIVLPAGNVEMQHARIVCEGPRCRLIDLKSTNGTYMNGRRIGKPVEIRPSDKICIGSFVLQLQAGGAAEVAHPPPRDSGAPEHRGGAPASSGELLRCGNCDGPLESADPSRPTITCSYCGFQSANRFYVPPR